MIARLYRLIACRVMPPSKENSSKIFYCSSEHNKEGVSTSKAGNDDDLPEEPTNCCMSGCDNCVWIQYAEELTKRFSDGDERVRNIILLKVSDPGMKVFLLSELKMLKERKR